MYIYIYTHMYIHIYIYIYIYVDAQMCIHITYILKEFVLGLGSLCLLLSCLLQGDQLLGRLRLHQEDDLTLNLPTNIIVVVVVVVVVVVLLLLLCIRQMTIVLGYNVTN